MRRHLIILSLLVIRAGSGGSESVESAFNSSGQQPVSARLSEMGIVSPEQL